MSEERSFHETCGATSEWRATTELPLRGQSWERRRRGRLTPEGPGSTFPPNSHERSSRHRHPPDLTGENDTLEARGRAARDGGAPRTDREAVLTSTGASRPTSHGESVVSRTPFTRRAARHRNGALRRSCRFAVSPGSAAILGGSRRRGPGSNVSSHISHERSSGAYQPLTLEKTPPSNPRGVSRPRRRRSQD